jgi:predicted Zn finger-like uncharacterized protein
MILTCPECATRYFVADDKVGADGKAVRCASCSHRWTAFREPEMELTTKAPALTVVPASAPAAEAAPVAEKPANAAPKLIREQAEVRKTVREAVVNGVVWAVMGAACVLMLVGAVVFRVDVVRLAPKTAGAYAMVGLPVNGTGLVFEDISAAPSLQDGHAALVVSGAIRNIEKRAVNAPSIRINVLDKEGHPVAHRVIDGPAGPIEPGASHQFVVAVLDPPAAADDVEVRFGPAQKAAKAPKGGHQAPAHGAPAGQHHGDPHEAEPAHHGAEASLRGSMSAEAPHIPSSPQPIMEAMEAKPLPSGSPYALHSHG